GHFRDARDIQDFGWRKAMAVDRIPFFDSGQKALVIIDFQIRVYAALHKNSGPTEGHRRLDFFVCDMIGWNVSLGIPLDSIKRAEGTKFFADVRVIDIPIDDVADDVVWVEAVS